MMLSKNRKNIMKYEFLSGNTFFFRDIIKAKGGKWDGNMKIWKVPQDVYEELKKIVSYEKKESVCQELKLEVQLWEQCKRCGREPVYMSLGHLCEDCGDD